VVPPSIFLDVGVRLVHVDRFRFLVPPFPREFRWGPRRSFPGVLLFSSFPHVHLWSGLAGVVRFACVLENRLSRICGQEPLNGEEMDV